MEAVRSILEKLKNGLGISSSTEKRSDTQTQGERQEAQVPIIPQIIDWEKWSRPVSGEVRSPCPAINALANHDILPHNGKGITKAMAVEALTKAYHLDSRIASVFAGGAVAANPDHSANSFDLNHVGKHGYIEHDVSLSRDDIAFGSNSDFSKDLFDDFLQSLHTKENACGAEETTTWKTASNARFARVAASKMRHEQQGKHWSYGIKEAVMSYGETGLYLSLLGKDGVAPLQWIKVFFEEERLPYNEGWRPPTKIDQPMLNHGFAEMIKAHEHGSEEAKMVGIGTFDYLKTAVLGLGSALMKTPDVK